MGMPDADLEGAGLSEGRLNGMWSGIGFSMSWTEGPNGLSASSVDHGVDVWLDIDVCI